jgi:hypothetical protein
MPEGYSDINYESFSNIENSNVENFDEELDTLAILVLQNTDDGYIQSQYDKYSETLEEYKNKPKPINNTDYNTLKRLLSNVQSSKDRLLDSLQASEVLIKLQRVKDSLDLKAKNLMTSYLNMRSIWDDMNCEANSPECRTAKNNVEKRLGEILPEFAKLNPEVKTALDEYNIYAIDNQEIIKNYVETTVKHNQNENIFIAAFDKAIGNTNAMIRKQVEIACQTEAERRYDVVANVTINNDFSCILTGRNFKQSTNVATAPDLYVAPTPVTVITTTDNVPAIQNTSPIGKILGIIFGVIFFIVLIILLANCMLGNEGSCFATAALLSTTGTTTGKTTVYVTTAPATAPTRVLGNLESSEYNTGLNRINQADLAVSEFN